MRRLPAEAVTHEQEHRQRVEQRGLHRPEDDFGQAEACIGDHERQPGQRSGAPEGAPGPTRMPCVQLAGKEAGRRNQGGGPRQQAGQPTRYQHLQRVIVQVRRFGRREHGRTDALLRDPLAHAAFVGRRVAARPWPFACQHRTRLPQRQTHAERRGCRIAGQVKPRIADADRDAVAHPGLGYAPGCCRHCAGQQRHRQRQSARQQSAHQQGQHEQHDEQQQQRQPAAAAAGQQGRRQAAQHAAHGDPLRGPAPQPFAILADGAPVEQPAQRQPGQAQRQIAEGDRVHQSARPFHPQRQPLPGHERQRRAGAAGRAQPEGTATRAGGLDDEHRRHRHAHAHGRVEVLDAVATACCQQGHVEQLQQEGQQYPARARPAHVQQTPAVAPPRQRGGGEQETGKADAERGNEAQQRKGQHQRACPGPPAMGGSHGAQAVGQAVGQAAHERNDRSRPRRTAAGEAMV